MVKKKSNIVEINGKRYDVVTGEALDAVRPAVAKQTNAPEALSRPSSETGRLMDVKRPQPHSLQHHRAEHSKTLMRHAVKKPAGGPKQTSKAVSRTDILARQPALGAVLPKLSAARIDPNKLARAGRITKSRLVSRFPLAAASSTVYKPHHPAAAVRTPQHARAAALGAVSTLAIQPSMNIFEQALAQATSHRQRPVVTARRRRRLIRVTSSAAAVVLLAGFIGYQNLTSFRMHVASENAGFAASLPGYHPSGFGLGKVSYSPGQVSLAFHSNSDDRGFAIIEKASDWDSQALYSNFVAQSGTHYHTVQAGGRLMYVLDQHVATWVSNGIWYQVQNHNALSDQQLAKLAGSM